VPAALFGMVLGLSGLGQAWRVAVHLWNAPALVGQSLLAVSVLLWLGLLVGYGVHALRNVSAVEREFSHPVEGGTPALLGIATLLTAQAVLPWSRGLGSLIAVAGLAWHVAFALWHTGTLWQGGRATQDATPTLYLPTVAGNFTAAASLGALGQTDWAWLFMGVGVLSWLALEPIVIRRLWHGDELPATQRPLLGIQFAPPVVCAAALFAIAPDFPSRWLLMLLGYGLFQMMVGLRLWAWMTSRAFAMSWWSYTFGVVSATVTCLKLALDGTVAARELAVPVFVAANVFILYLCVRTMKQIVEALRTSAAA
jgi:tellurite resistance protein